MGVLSVVLLVFFVVVALLLVLLVLAQNEEGDSLGGIFAGGSGSAFGSRSGNVLTRATSVLGGLFLLISLALALVNRTPGGGGVEKAGRELAPESATEWWNEGNSATENETPESEAPEAQAPAGTAPAPESVPAGEAAEEAATPEEEAQRPLE
ncbi:MAG: Preprotein translocase subunit SecG [Treponematales bacterium]